MSPGLADLARARDSWLARALSTLDSDDRVLAAVLVGSLGRGEADEWSDIDMVLVTPGDHVGTLMANQDEARRLGETLFPVGRWRARVVGGMTYASVTYQAEDWPIWVDWHVHDLAIARVPVDARVAFDKQPIPRDARSFSDLLVAAGLTQATFDPPLSTTELAAWRVSLLPIAAKYFARGAPSIASMIELVGGIPPGQRTAELETLWRLLERDRAHVPGDAAEAVAKVLRIAAAPE